MHRSSFWGPNDIYMHHMLATYDPQYITDHILAILELKRSNMQQLMTRNMQEGPQYYAVHTPPTPIIAVTYISDIKIAEIMIYFTHRHRHRSLADLRTFQGLGTRLCSGKCSRHHFALLSVASCNGTVSVEEIQIENWQEV